MSKAPTRRTTWVELDILRGLAGIIMVENHAAARWLDEAQRQEPLSAALFLIGSYAPVIFFATTGIGYGIQSELPKKRKKHAFGFIRKVAILLVADALLWLGRGIWIGLDFLGFIALSMLLLEPLRRRRVGWIVPLVAVAVVAGLRYGVTPIVMPNPGQPAGMLEWLTGVGSPPGFSYPILPWIGMRWPASRWACCSSASRTSSSSTAGCSWPDCWDWAPWASVLCGGSPRSAPA